MLRKNDYVKNYQQILRRHLLFEEFLEYLLHVYAGYKSFAKVINYPNASDDYSRSTLFGSFRYAILTVIRQFSEVTGYQ